MAFPTNPSPGDSYTDTYGTVWVYAGAVNGWYRQEVSTPNDTSYTAAISGPAGSNTQVQFNDNGGLAGDSGLTYNKTTDALSGGAFVPTGNTVPTNGLYLPSANNVAISANGTGRLFVGANGNVGVGTNAPLLTIHAKAATAGLRLEESSASSKRLDISIDNSAVARISAPQSASSIAFETTGAERLRITSDGKVGLGTSSPQAIVTSKPSSAFSVSTSDFSGEGVHIDASNATAGNNLYGGSITWSRNGTAGTKNAAIASVQTGADSDLGGLAFFTHQSTSNGDPLIEAVRIDSSGRVGVGTTEPNRRLELVDGNNTLAEFSRSTAGEGAIRVGNIDGNVYLGSSQGDVNITASSSTGRFFFNSGANNRLTIDSSGRLLVGTSSARSNFVSSIFSGTQQIEAANNASNIGLSITNGSSLGYTAVLALNSHKTNSIGGTGATTSGFTQGQIQFNGSDGTNFIRGALIAGAADGDWSSGDCPGRLVFSTTADGASSPTERMRIKSTGIVNVGNTPVYADNAAAKTGGLVDGDIYRKSDGTLMIVYT